MADNTGILYGETKTYKSWNLALLAKYIFSKTRKPVRWITADAGGYKPAQPFVDAGIIIPLKIDNDPMRLTLIRKIMEGYFPQDVEGGIRQSKKMLTPDSLSSIGGYIFEGATSIAESLLNLYAGRTTGMKPAYTETIKSELTTGEKNIPLNNEILGGFSQDSYGLVQAEMMRLLRFSWNLPIPYVWWSGHESLGEDKTTKSMIRGIGFVGSAATPRIGKNVGEMIHAYRVETGNIKDIGGGKKEKEHEVRYYYQTHLDRNIPNAFWEASPRLSGTEIPKLLEKFPNGYFIPSYNEGLDKYIKEEENLLEVYTNEMIEWKEKILKGE